jgi:hypothetical protein
MPTHKVHWVDLKWAVLPPIPPLTSPQFPRAFVKKCDHCCVRCNFRIEAADEQAKAQKTADLLDILRVCDTIGTVRRFPPAAIRSLTKCISSNLVREPSGVQTVVSLSDEPQNVIDPEWVHLAIVYQLLHRTYPAVLDAAPSAIGFLCLLLPQLASPDERERAQLCEFYQVYLDGHERRCPHFLVSLISFLDASNGLRFFSHFAVSFLSILPSLLRNGKAKTVFHAHLQHIIRVLLTAPTLPFFQSQLIGFITSNWIGIREDLEIVATLPQCWPVIFPLKQVSFLKILGILLVRVASRLTNDAKPGLFRRVFRLIAEGCTSQSSAVAQAALALLVDSSLDMFVADHSRSIFPILCPAYMEAASSHWTPEVREAGKRAMQFLSKIDPVMFKEASSGQPRLQSSRKSWATIAAAATERDSQIMADLKRSPLRKGVAATISFASLLAPLDAGS